MPLEYGTPQNVTASEVVHSIFADVDAAFYDVKYPGTHWPDFVAQDQIVSTINPGATTYSYMSRARDGKAAFLGNGPTRNIPTVAQSLGSVNIPLAASACGAEITNEDARQHAFGLNASLASDLGELMRRACDDLVERTTFFGDKALGWFGALALPVVRVVNASAPFSPTSAQGMVDTINMGLSIVWEGSKQIHAPTHVFLPPTQFGILATTPMVLNSTPLAMTALEYVRKNNVITASTGKELEFKAIRYLKGAGVGGLDRMMIMERSKENQVLPFPMAYTLADPVPAELAVKLFAEQKHGPYHERYPLSTVYVDNI